MDRVSAEDVTGGIDYLLDRVAQGEEIEITRAGRPVAKLSSSQPPSGQDADPSRAKDGVARFRELRESIRARGESFTWEELKEMRDEDRP